VAAIAFASLDDLRSDDIPGTSSSDGDVWRGSSGRSDDGGAYALPHRLPLTNIAALGLGPARRDGLQERGTFRGLLAQFELGHGVSPLSGMDVVGCCLPVAGRRIRRRSAVLEVRSTPIGYARTPARERTEARSIERSERPASAVSVV
jgi:hypothetical protein